MQAFQTVEMNCDLSCKLLHCHVQANYELNEMAAVVDAQNAQDPNYKPMAPHCTNIEFQAAVDIIFNGKDIPNGYTEGLLTKHRRAYKAEAAAQL